MVYAARQARVVLDAQQPELDSIDSFGGLQRWRDKVLALQANNGCTLGCPLGTLVAALADDELGRLALASAFDDWQHRLRDGLAAMHDKGEVTDSVDLDALALGLLAAT